ncbi:hypothetical protein C943_04629 [Mariniradius saccharolyticus AK6]|uniref:Uncharacterized protein n=1 Tax=Mariniradius saccharolyticus AK6 TaxID=1239962 RepID=M7X8M8_9BACT|nr:hypothetical protein C943_04629 [Mariniradius saccharolyticus AK6]
MGVAKNGTKIGIFSSIGFFYERLLRGTNAEILRPNVDSFPVAPIYKPIFWNPLACLKRKIPADWAGILVFYFLWIN